MVTEDKKKLYVRPVLVVYGSVRNLTSGSTGAKADGRLGGNMQ